MECIIINVKLTISITRLLTRRHDSTMCTKSLLDSMLLKGNVILRINTSNLICFMPTRRGVVINIRLKGVAVLLSN